MIGVILANTGSPTAPEPDAIEAYLREFLMDDRIRQMPKPFWKFLLNKHILPKRKHSSAKRYQFIWTEDGSPLVLTLASLAEKVQEFYASDETCDESIMVRAAMSYGKPSLVGVLGEFRAAGVTHVVLLPLYPQSAYSPTLAVVDAFQRAQDALGWHPESVVINNYHDHPRYIDAMVHAIQGAGFDAQAGDRLLLSLHAIPLKDQKAGDTYCAQVEESKRLIAEGLEIDPASITVSYQSVFGHDSSKWTSPLTIDVLAEWAEEDFRVVFACPGFAIDCLETLYDIPHEMVPALEGDGAVPTVSHVEGDIQAVCNTGGRFVWVPTLNDSDEHVAMVKAILDQRL